MGACSNLVPLKKTTRKPKRNIYFEIFPHEFVLSLYLKTLLYNWNNVKICWRIASQMWWNCYSVQQESLNTVAGGRACYLIKQRVKERDQICVCYICFHFPFPLAISDSNEDLKYYADISYTSCSREQISYYTFQRQSKWLLQSCSGSVAEFGKEVRRPVGQFCTLISKLLCFPALQQHCDNCSGAQAPYFSLLQSLLNKVFSYLKKILLDLFCNGVLTFMPHIKGWFW